MIDRFYGFGGRCLGIVEGLVEGKAVLLQARCRRAQQVL